MKDIIIISKRPFRDSNCRYAFRLATTQTGGGSLSACNAGCSRLVKSRSRGRPLPHTSKKVKKYIRSKKEKLSYGNRRLGRLLTLNFHFSIAKLKLFLPVFFLSMLPIPRILMYPRAYSCPTTFFLRLF